MSATIWEKENTFKSTVEWLSGSTYVDPLVYIIIILAPNLMPNWVFGRYNGMDISAMKAHLAFLRNLKLKSSS